MKNVISAGTYKGSSIILLGGFLAGRRGALDKIDGIMKKGNYTDILKQHLKTSERKLNLVCK